MNPDLKERILDGLMLLLACGALYVAIRVWPGKAHEHQGVDYSQWQTATKGSCCNNADCEPIDERDLRFKGGVPVEAHKFGVWFPIPAQARDSQPLSPDHRYHLCATATEGVVTVYCFRMPSDT